MATSDPDLLNQQSLAQPDTQECPWAYYRALHEQADGLFFDPQLGMYVCADYALMREIMRNTRVFSNVNSQNVAHMRPPPQEVRDIQAASIRPVNILVSSDPPEHTRVRKLLDDPFRPRAIEKIRPQIRDIVNNTIDRFMPAAGAAGEFEAVADFAIPIPVTVIADILGLDRKHADAIKEWSDASVEPLGMMISDQRWIECARHIKEFQDFITAELEARRQQPRQDLLTHLVQARDPQGQPLTLGEMLAVTQQLLVAGNETTTNGIAAGLQLLLENPQQQQQLRDNPERMLVFVNEVLRLESPVQGLFRVVTEDVKLKDVELKAGARIMLRYAAANRDGKKYPQPDQLDIQRKNAGTQVGFGAGIHHCLGANLAREEMVQSFSILLQRLSRISLADNQPPLQHHPSLILRGLKSLHVKFAAAAEQPG